MNRVRRILVRWEKKPAHYLAFLHFACALIAVRAAVVLVDINAHALRAATAALTKHGVS